MARKRDPKFVDLPPNLYARNDGYYSFRDPRTGKEYGLGRDKRYAVTQAIEANLEIYAQLKQPASLLERITNVNTVTLAQWLTEYLVHIERRGLKPKTLKDYRRISQTITNAIGDINIRKIDTKTIVDFLSTWRDAGKVTMFNNVRQFLRDSLFAAIAEGYIETNPAEHIRREKVVIARERLSLEHFNQIADEADFLYPWGKLSFELALLTGQRLTDVFSMKWTDIRERKIYVEQSKTGMKIAIDIDNGLKGANRSISDVLDQLRELSNDSDRVVPALSSNQITVAFTRARERTGLEWKGSAPTFHEIRSLSARLYTDEKGAEFAQRILGHKSASMTERYIDSRGSEWTSV